MCVYKKCWCRVFDYCVENANMFTNLTQTFSTKSSVSYENSSTNICPKATTMKNAIKFVLIVCDFQLFVYLLLKRTV